MGLFLNKYSIEFTAIEIGGSETSESGRKPLPSGAAFVMVKVPPDQTNDDIIQSIQGKTCGGRALRVQKAYQIGDNRRRSSGPGGGSFGRYFERDISTKCHICGEVGHKMQDCTNDKVPVPCHLCAGTDHEAGLLLYRYNIQFTTTFSVLPIAIIVI